VFTHPAYGQGQYPADVEYLSRDSSLFEAFEANHGFDENYTDPLLQGRWTAVSTRVDSRDRNFLVIVQQHRD